MDHPESPQRWTLGAVSFLNTRPLIRGLERDDGVALVCDVPARLPALLEAGSVDAALIPIVDLVHPDHDWQIVSDACIASCGRNPHR